MCGEASNKQKLVVLNITYFSDTFGRLRSRSTDFSSVKFALYKFNILKAAIFVIVNLWGSLILYLYAGNPISVFYLSTEIYVFVPST